MFYTCRLSYYVKSVSGFCLKQHNWEEDLKTKLFFEKVQVMQLHSAIVFVSNVPFLKFLLIHLLSMKLNSLQETCIHPWRGFNCPLYLKNSSAEAFLEEECRGRLPTWQFLAMAGILRKVIKSSALLPYLNIDNFGFAHSILINFVSFCCAE